MKKPIRIIGAGPSGLCAAINLARVGYPVIVYERSIDVGTRFHGDFQGVENWSTTEDFLTTLQKMSIRPDFLCQPYTTGQFYMKGDYGGTVTSSKPLFYLTLRGNCERSLDRSLLQQAQEVGVEVRFGQRRSATEGEIIATGPARPNVLASGVTFRTSLSDTIMATLHNRIAPWGYAYLLVRKNRGTLATVYYKDFKNSAEHLNRSIQYFQKKVSFDMNNAKRFTGYGDFVPTESAAHNGRLYVGEAAGFQDFLFGFGIRYALTSGYLAARSIIEGEDYNVLWKKQFGKQLSTSLSNRYLYQMFGTLAHRFIVWRATRGNPWRFMNRFYNSAASRVLAYTPAERWLKQSTKRKAIRQ
jgi:flavin-dependent dehydrogenase